MFRRIFWTALVVALFTGALVTPLQLYSTVPLILEAEIHEGAQMAAAHPMGTGTHAVHEHGHEHGHEQIHDHADAHDAEWTPDNGAERTFYTGLTTILAAFGYALVLCALCSLLPAAGWLTGLLLGLAGYISFQIAPALGLPLLPPGVEQSEIAGRQLWWLFSASATAAAIGCAWLAWQRRRAAYAVTAVGLLLLPWLIGAPVAPASQTVIPDELLRDFRIAALLIAGVFWSVLGITTGLLWDNRRWLRSAQEPAGQ